MPLETRLGFVVSLSGRVEVVILFTNQPILDAARRVAVPLVCFRWYSGSTLIISGTLKQVET